MKRVLYISNIEVPYRVRFFNELAKYCDLTVLYESRGTGKRDTTWSKSEKKRYRSVYYGRNTLPLLLARYDLVILGCYQTPLQIATALLFKLLRRKFRINLDGEPFLQGKGWKPGAKRLLLRLATGYLVAGESAAWSLRAIAGKKPITVYPFGSLTEAQLGRCPDCKDRTGTILVVGQYFPYKGMDVALEAARRDGSLSFLFVGMGSRTEKFRKDHKIPSNVQLIPFLQPEELHREYASCALVVLPSRRECWGLVIPEAAAFGAPIVSTWGSGAAVEFLAERYPQFLAKPGDPEGLLDSIHRCLASDRTAYGAFLREAGSRCSIEAGVAAHRTLLEGEKP